MTKKILFLLLMIVPLIGQAQNQKGYVKTKGRMVDGKYLAGKGLPGATVTLEATSTMVCKKATVPSPFL